MLLTSVSRAPVWAWRVSMCTCMCPYFVVARSIRGKISNLAGFCGQFSAPRTTRCFEKIELDPLCILLCNLVAMCSGCNVFWPLLQLKCFWMYPMFFSQNLITYKADSNLCLISILNTFPQSQIASPIWHTCKPFGNHWMSKTKWHQSDIWPKLHTLHQHVPPTPVKKFEIYMKSHGPHGALRNLKLILCAFCSLYNLVP